MPSCLRRIPRLFPVAGQRGLSRSGAQEPGRGSVAHHGPAGCPAAQLGSASEPVVCGAVGARRQADTARLCLKPDPVTPPDRNQEQIRLSKHLHLVEMDVTPMMDATVRDLTPEYTMNKRTGS